MRHTVRRPVVLAATAFAALSLTLTACNDGSGAKSAGTSAPSAAQDGAKDSAAGTDTAGKDATAGDKAEGKDDKTGGQEEKAGQGTSGGKAPATQAGSKASKKGKAPACTVNDVKISAAKQDGTPTTHITLTAKNTSGRACTLLQYPLLAFGDIQTAKDVPAVAKSKPGTPVVLQPGAPAYAAVRVNNGGREEENHAVNSFNVNLFAADGPAEGSKVVSVAGGIAVDDAVAKTGYWTPELRNGADEF
ncbi:DUF4232 domain-containing protein [Streptomyces sp. NPDC004111]|uniref:DUF4232 domain-containing protein n=1 Tax=Streptomyces sp. NPDC004111 TaxID=3364690 RepID=UPI0036B19F7B